MSEYTSTRDGFQRAMEWSLTGSPEDAKLYAEGTVTSNFYHVMNGQHLAYDAYIKGIADWRGQISDYKPKVWVPTSHSNAMQNRSHLKLDADGTSFSF
jgi:hypothetical protein